MIDGGRKMWTPEESLEFVDRFATPEIVAAVNRRIEKGELPPHVGGRFTGNVGFAGGLDVAGLKRAFTPDALEAIVRTTGRPPLLVKEDKVVLEPLPGLPANTRERILANEKWIKSVGRVEFVNAGSPWGGTGWVIDRKADGDIVATNRHVAKIVARRMANGQAVFLRNAAGVRMAARLDFREEASSIVGNASFTVPLSSIVYLADDLSADVCLLKIVLPSPLRRDPIPLADKEARLDELVATIGYPAQDSRNAADPQEKYFRSVYNVKRFAPGKVIQALGGDQMLSHDCTTLGGNSGSPLLSLDSGKVVGLHFAGVYGRNNSAVGVGTLKNLLAGRIVAVAGPRLTEAPQERPDAHHAAEFFKGRRGFSTRFLGTGKATPWPKLPAAMAASLAQPSDKPREKGELRYTNFGVKYAADVKLPLITAVNIDGAKAKRIKRGSDQWFSDGRIPREVQLNAGNYADAEIDRGHMVRREDPNWGRQAQVANDDTFHYVNACPQHGDLNQGKLLWQGLENFILDSVRTSGARACVFTGPIIGEDDPEIDGARVPLEYWKLVATEDDQGKLRATAYVLSQGQLIRSLMEQRRLTESMEGLELGAYRTFQIAVADLAAATGYDLTAYVAADPLHTVQEGAAQPVFLTLASLDEMVL